MKRLLVFSILIFLVLFLLTACVPIESPKPELPFAGQNEDKPSTISPNVTDVIAQINPVSYLLDASGDKAYGVYEFTVGGNHCIAVADVYISGNGDSNSAPSLFCERVTK